MNEDKFSFNRLFFNQVLVEKLLRSCGGIGNKYLLIRPKKGQNVSTSLEK